jgi:two-component system, LuxR family, sensor kinase FixL
MSADLRLSVTRSLMAPEHNSWDSAMQYASGSPLDILDDLSFDPAFPDFFPADLRAKMEEVLRQQALILETMHATERQQLQREIIEIANREQQRIGSDLHDGLGQDLTGIALMLRGVVAQLGKEGSAARRDVEEVIDLVNDAIENTRTVARGLSPVTGGLGSLAAAIQTLAAGVSQRFSVNVSSHLDFEEPLRLSETAAAHVYRIVQEALTNVVRHSGASEVSIHLETAHGELHLRVDDNGRGFRPPPERPEGLGLKIMRYRAQMLGGDLAIAGDGSGGASVRCSCPLAASGLGSA